MFKVGDTVTNRWYPEFTGTVTKIYPWPKGVMEIKTPEGKLELACFENWFVNRNKTIFEKETKL